MTTSEFGQRWLQLSAEVKQSIVCPGIRSLESLRNAMVRVFYHVESIQNSGEAIFSATGAAGGSVLVHIKLQPLRQGADITVKSSAREVCSAELAPIVSALSNSF